MPNNLFGLKTGATYININKGKRALSQRTHTKHRALRGGGNGLRATLDCCVWLLK